jgi:glycosyltransferase involved in cell wall biosynthesis
VQLVRRTAALPERLDLPLVVDLVDALSLNLERRAGHEIAPLRALLRSEAARLLRFERALCTRAQAVTVVSPLDREAIGDLPRLHVNRNGVDLERFAPPTSPRDPHLLVFTGNLGYFPNADAARRLARDVMPRIWREAPQARLALVGARPTRAVRRLAALDARLELHADVPDVAPYLTRASVALLPLQAGSGQLFKLLEALACATPVVATPRALAGVEVEPGRHVRSAESVDELAGAALALLGDPARAAALGAAGRAYVAERHSWERVTAELEALWEQALSSPAQG